MGSDSESETNPEWQAELELLISDNAQTNWTKISNKRAFLAGQVTQACNKAQKTYDRALKTRKFDPEEVEKRLLIVQLSTHKLEYLCKICVDAFTPEMKTSTLDEFTLSSNYFGRYLESANLAVSQMKSLKRGKEYAPPAGAGTTPKTDITSGKDEASIAAATVDRASAAIRDISSGAAQLQKSVEGAQGSSKNFLNVPSTRAMTDPTGSHEP